LNLGRVSESVIEGVSSLIKESLESVLFVPETAV
jgi:hypothetical protein